MIPDDKVKDDSAVDKSPGFDLKSWLKAHKAQVVLAARVVSLGLIVSAVLMVRFLVNSERVKVIKASAALPTKTRIVSSKELEAYTLLTNDHLIVIQGTNDSDDPKAINEFLGRYLLTKVAPGTEIKSDMLAPVEAKALLDNSVAVTIPATATSSLGGQLRVGDMVDLLAILTNQPLANQSDKSKPPTFENLLVLSIPIKKDPKTEEKNVAEVSAITVALPATKRDEFASSIAGATIVITRRVAVK